MTDSVDCSVVLPSPRGREGKLSALGFKSAGGQEVSRGVLERGTPSTHPTEAGCCSSRAPRAACSSGRGWLLGRAFGTRSPPNWRRFGQEGPPGCRGGRSTWAKHRLPSASSFLGVSLPPGAPGCRRPRCFVRGWGASASAAATSHKPEDKVKGRGGWEEASAVQF